MCVASMENMENKSNDGQWSAEPTIRFTIDPALLKQDACDSRRELEDTYVGAPLLPPEEEPPRPHRGPAPLWTRIAVLCAMGALALSLLVSFLPRPWFGRSAQETVDDFITALDTGDFQLLRSVALGDGVELTEQALAPLFAVSRDDPTFGQGVRALLQDPATRPPDQLFWLEDRSSALRSDYVVHLATTQAVVRSNLPQAQITVGGAEAAWDEQQGAAVTERLLPGVYTVHGAYAAPHGDTFQADATLYLANPQSSCALQFDYATMEVYNSAAESVRIQVNGSDVATLEPQKELVIGPVTADAQITAVGPRDQLLSATAAEGYFYVSFAMCQLEVYNDYDVPMHVALGGVWYADIPARGKLAVADVPAGQELTVYLDEAYGLEPFRYQAAYDFDYLYPTFSLRQEPFEALRLTAETYALVAYEAYAAGAEALAQLPDTALTRDLAALLNQEAPQTLTAEGIFLSEYGGMTFLPDGVVRLNATVSVAELSQEPVAEDAEIVPEQAPVPVEREKHWTLQLQWQEGLWTVLPTQPPAEQTQQPPEETAPVTPEAPVAA